MALTPRPDRPIDPVTLSIIRAVADTSAHFGLDAFMVGATARTILLEHIFGLHAGRATRDIDFAFAVENWEQFQAIKQYLTTNKGFEEVGRVAQRLMYKPPASSTKFVIDLIPFGGVECEQNHIAWPPDMSVVMNVAGYRDAHAAAVTVEVEPGLAVSIASVPGIAVLKIYAWVDRRHDNPKDAMDMHVLLQQYHQAGNLERLYEDAISALESVDYDVERAGAWLLGCDAFAISSASTREQLVKIFADQSLMDHLVIDMSRSTRLSEDDLNNSKALWQQFLAGFEQASAV